MADRYWVSNANSNANTASNWNTAANGTGSSGIPAASDVVYIGHSETLAANLGNGICTWDITPTIDTMTVYSGYNSLSETSSNISFTNPSTITHADVDWDSLGYRVGMKIGITGATDPANNGTFDIASIATNEITITQTSLVTEPVGASVTVAYSAYLDVQANFGMNLLTLDGHIRNNSGSDNTITFSGTHASGGDNRYILNGDNQTATATNLIYSVDGSANGAVATYIDDGYYPQFIVTGSTALSFGYKAPTSTVHGQAVFGHFETGSSVTTPVDSSASPKNNQSRSFIVETASGFSVGGSLFDTGKSSWEFQLDSASFAFPVSDGTTTYRWYNLSITTKSAGRKATLASNRTLSVNSLTIGAEAVLEGHKTRGEASSTVMSVRRPKILGAWNFKQLSDGIYVSLMETAFPITPSQGASTTVQLSNGAGAFTSDEQLTFANDTLSVDKGVKFLENADHPTAPAAGTGVLWVKNGTPNTLVFTDDAGTDTTLGSGGGGGAVSSVFGRTGAVVATEGDYDLDELGDVTITGTPTELQVLIYDGSEWVNGWPEVKMIQVRNDEGSTIPAGAPIYSRGEIGGSNRIKVGIADANDSAKMPCIGIAYEEMNTTSTQDNYAVVGGVYNANISGFTGLSEGDILYVSNTGTLTQTRPTGVSDAVQNIGIVLKTNGTICQGLLVATIGRSNDVPNQFSITGSITAGSFIKSGGSSSEFLKADGSVDTNTYLSSVAPITLDTGNNRVGINEASPDYDLHVHSGNSNYSVKFEHGEGQTLFNRFGHIQIFNDNSFPLDGSTLDNPVWQIGQRDGGQLDIALGNITTQLVPASKKLLELKRVGNTESGAPQIGFLGTTAVSQQSATASSNTASAVSFAPLPPAVDPLFDPDLATRMTDIETALNNLTTTVGSIKTSVDSIITALQAYGLLS